MRTMKTLCLLACIVASVCAAPNQKQMSNQELKPSKWLTSHELESTPGLDEMSLERLENMSVDKGAKLLRKLYHVAHIDDELRPSFVPSASNIPVAIMKPNGQKIETKLNNLVSKAKELPEFGDDEVTIFITGLPQTSPTITKATKKLVKAYMQRYNLQQQQKDSQQPRNKDNEYSSSEETSDEWKSAKTNSGDLVIIDLGATLTNFKRYALLDIEETGDMLGKVLVRLADEADVPHEIIHIVAQGIASHVAGAAGNQFTQQTGHKLRRITALDPSKILAKHENTLTGLARGDAEFVDAIHTSAYGMGTTIRVGDVDFYPNGPSDGVPGAENVVEAAMRATRYYAESVRPGNERNFPAVPANSLKQYKQNNGFGKRTYMGIDVDYDLEGDYILQVDAKCPFGQRATAKKQTSYHGMHQA